MPRMAPPISQVRAILDPGGGNTARSPVSTLNPTALAANVRSRGSVAVPVGDGLRIAAWVGLIGALLAAFVQPFVVQALDPADGYQNFILRIIDRGTWWTVAAGIAAAIGVVSMIFTRGADEATRPGLVGLAVNAVTGTAAGLPAAAALVIGVVTAVAIVAAVIALIWFLLALVFSS
jgi:hypothetical protein